MNNITVRFTKDEAIYASAQLTIASPNAQITQRLIAKANDTAPVHFMQLTPNDFDTIVCADGFFKNN